MALVEAPAGDPAFTSTVALCLNAFEPWQERLATSTGGTARPPASACPAITPTNFAG